eukprot:CAMPEP_0201705208 /NCGR_PEP_ID=MMETSP0578-20130828/45078_1 /ASSEMBLY_ACC=CAM_ASM_000663 /TAXON_ID=267565 /ORGANISM="Skeletonema grethea, Strain CCMP 1804" /LENGTH=59 /DNA_ID=CAMNT_0048193399 /DNA_START=52 /DNA_END=228 /DNA_ORIENTATION=-
MKSKLNRGKKCYNSSRVSSDVEELSSLSEIILIETILTDCSSNESLNASSSSSIVSLDS